VGVWSLDLYAFHFHRTDEQAVAWNGFETNPKQHVVPEAPFISRCFQKFWAKILSF